FQLTFDLSPRRFFPSFGTQVHKWCGSQKANLTVTNKNVQLVFEATRATPHFGFKLEYSMKGCSENYTSPYGRIKANKFYQNFENDACLIRIQAPISNTTISLYFDSFFCPRSTSAPTGAENKMILILSCNYKTLNMEENLRSEELRHLLNEVYDSDSEISSLHDSDLNSDVGEEFGNELRAELGEEYSSEIDNSLNEVTIDEQNKEEVASVDDKEETEDKGWREWVDCELKMIGSFLVLFIRAPKTADAVNSPRCLSFVCGRPSAGDSCHGK
ncbi:hypothetical protein J6590_017578, partial [Homalodisca vitripennis]